jgi:hypothetical protein
MKRLVWFGIGAVVFLVPGTPGFLDRIDAARDAAAFQAQLRLARADGLPTTAAEFAAGVHPARPAENAAGIYLMLPAFHKKNDTPSGVEEELVFHPSAKTRAAAETLLNDRREYLTKIDEAVSKPHCWWNRDWSQGFTNMPEDAEMRTAAKFLALRASLKASNGHPEAALGDIQKIFAMSRQAAEDPTSFAGFVHDSIAIMALQRLAWWSFAHPRDGLYRLALRSSMSKFPELDLKRDHRMDLYSMLWLVDSTLTPEGRRVLGLHGDQESIGLRLGTGPISQSRARIEIVRAERELWMAIRLPASLRDKTLADATAKLNKCILAFPDASSVMFQYTQDPLSDSPRQKQRAARKETYVAICRALANATVAQRIETKDLLSPFDGQPLRYHFDGRQIDVEVSMGDEDHDSVTLKIPPDPLSIDRPIHHGITVQ